MAQTEVKSTFTGTGQSSSVQGRMVDISISGSGTVDIQRRIGGNWRTIETITDTGERVIENATSLEHRLDCTAYTSTITYALVAQG